METQAGAGSLTPPPWLLVAATEMELAPLRAALASFSHLDFLVCGVGPTAAAAGLAAYLAACRQPLSGVIISGVAGAYPSPDSSLEKPGYPLQLLDICLARREILADFGVAAPHGADPLTGKGLDGTREFVLDADLCQRARTLLQNRGVDARKGVFLTVNAASSTLERGLALARRHRAICENMEGAAAALVCRSFSVPLLELRCISNLVENRDLSRWRLARAIARNAEIAAMLISELCHSQNHRPHRAA